MKKFIIKILTVILRLKGYSSYLGMELIKEIKDDLFKNRATSLKQKIWAYRRGFLSSKIRDYGLTEMNYKRFLSDFDYCKLYPVNGRFGQWIDDKLTSEYMLSPFKEYLPKYYYHIKMKGSIIPLMDCKATHRVNTEDILELLKKEHNLALKLVSGSLGVGFYKISCIENVFFINESVVKEVEMFEFLSKLEQYLVTEYLVEHHEISRIYSKSPNALRVMVVNEDGTSPIIANALMRFGTKETGVIDAACVGGVFAIVDVENGRYYNSKKIDNHHIIKCGIHPDTQVIVEGILPYWN